MPRPNWIWAARGWIVYCEKCRGEFGAKTATKDATCPFCGHVTKRMRDPAISAPAHARAAHGVIGLLSEDERRGRDEFDRATNSQWSPMHSLWLDALRANLPVIEMADRDFILRFEMVREKEPARANSAPPSLLVKMVRDRDSPKLHVETRSLRWIRLRVASTDGRLEFAERVDAYANDRKTVQAMFLALRSVLGRIPEVSRPRLAL